MRRRDDGFTLLEILVAFAIASIAIATIFASLRTAVGHEARALEGVRRLLEAWSRIEEAAAAPGAGPQDGVLATGEAWRLETRPLEALREASGEARGPQPVAITLTVHDGGRETLRLDTVALIPE